MADELTDPELPPGAVVEVREDGTAIRNDGKVLQPAARNPWYVLATVAGEPSLENDISVCNDIAARNQRYWNGWACEGLDDAQRAALAEKLELDVADLAPLRKDEWRAIHAAFRERLGDIKYIPNPFGEIDFTKTHFPEPVYWEKYCFPAETDFGFATFGEFANFSFATFDSSTDFTSATFSKAVTFFSATFSGYASFTSATFSKDAIFQFVTFSKTANFASAYFGSVLLKFSGTTLFTSATYSAVATFSSATSSGTVDIYHKHLGTDLEKLSETANFTSAIFEGPASFEDAIFYHGADFSDGSFAAQTVFKGAEFRQRVPKFYQRVLHQDTSFTTEQNHWPTITAAIAEESKRAYTRLRQLMLELEKPDDAHFFFRQEMRCKAYLEGCFYRRINWLFALFSNYGHSLGRPVAGLAVLWLLPFCIYCLSGVFFDGQQWSIGRAALFSFSNLLPFGLTFLHFGPDFMRSLGPCLQLLAGSQTVLGFVFLFLLGLGLRNRFRLK